MKEREPDAYSDKEAERRATDALRRALATPYKPQSAMVGQAGRNAGEAKKATRKKGRSIKP